MSVLDFAISLAKERRGLEERLWEQFAYAARYGRQPMSEIKAMSLPELGRFISEVSRIVKEENRPREE